MRSAVVYLSVSGQTKKVADAIAEALPGDVIVAPMQDDPPLDDRDVVFVGLPIQQFGPPTAAREYLERACAGRRVALFVTHSSPEGPGPVDEWVQKCRDAASSAEIVGCFDCQGELAQGVKDMMLKSGSPDLKRWAETDDSQGKPDPVRLDRARAFAREVAEAVQRADP